MSILITFTRLPIAFIQIKMRSFSCSRTFKGVVDVATDEISFLKASKCVYTNDPEQAFKQGRREPRVGPGTAQILRISGFVQSKSGKENGTLFSGFSSDLKKKGLHRN